MIFYFFMASPSSNNKASQNNPKRPRENDSDTSENKHSQPTTSSATSSTSPRFLVITSKEERSMSSHSPFSIRHRKSTARHSWCAKKHKKLRSGDLLVEYEKKKQIENLLRLNDFLDLKVKVSLHGSLKICKGIVCCPDLKEVSEQEILENMREQGVIYISAE